MRLRWYFLALVLPALIACEGRQRPDVEQLEGDALVDFDAQLRPDAPCPDAQVPCGPSCKNLSNDPENCGACGNNCRMLPGVVPDRVSCRNGVCDVTGACMTGKAHCTMMASDGCEANITTPMQCGACGTACMEPRPMCTAVPGDGGMTYACSDGCFAPTGTRCNMECVNVSDDARHCGRCGNMCTAPANAEPTCDMGRCSFRCMRGYEDCDGEAANGCETETRSDVNNCGRCRNACSPATNATPSCVMGLCGIDCRMGFANCDGNMANGCEITSATNTTHCGRCGNRCVAATGSTASCVMGECMVGCPAGRAECDSNLANGCETDILSDNANCGGCRTTCAAATVINGMRTCVEGMCGIRCNVGFADCDSDPANGCEVRLANDPTNCGRCANRCPTGGPGMVGICNAGVCGTPTCGMGQLDCDRDPMNGCETNTLADPNNCGACGATPCVGYTNAPPTCRAGACVFQCTTGTANCDGNMANGCEVDSASSVGNCGTCGTRCMISPTAMNATPACQTGVCGIACSMGYADCDRNTANGCEIPTNSSATNCGSCGTVCSSGPRGRAACRMGSCALDCDTGFGDCDNNVINGCETNVQTSNEHCGRCGNMCSALPGTTGGCMAGTCQYTCRMGFRDCNMDLMMPTSDGCETMGTMCP